MEKLDIHGTKDRLERATRLLRNPISKRNAELILSFGNHCVAEGLGTPRVVRYLNLLRQVARWLGKDFDKAEKGDIERLVQKLERAVIPRGRSTISGLP